MGLFKLVESARVSSRELIETLEALATNGKDLGYIEASQVIALFGRCDPPLSRGDLERLKGYCRRASTDLEQTGKSWAAQDWGKIVDAIEARLSQMPR